MNILVGPSGVYFQDSKFSKYLLYSDIGPMASVSFDWFSGRHLVRGGLLASYSQSRPYNTDAMFEQYSGVAYAQYGYFIAPGLSLGGQWNIGDIFYQRRDKESINNSFYVNLSSNIGLAVNYNFKKLGLERLNMSVYCALIGYMKEEPGFSFSLPQKQLEANTFNYNNRSSIIDFRYFEWMFLWKNYTYVHASLTWDFSRHWSAFYLWQYSRQTIVKGYPSVFGAHNLGIIYSFRL